MSLRRGKCFKGILHETLTVNKAREIKQRQKVILIVKSTQQIITLMTVKNLKTKHPDAKESVQ